jgi:hypothetical protein
MPVFIKLNELKLRLCGCSSLDQWAQIVRFSVIIFANGSRMKCSRYTNSTMISLVQCLLPIGELQVRGHVVFDNVRCST